MLTRKAAIAKVLQLQAQLDSTVGYETRKAIRERVARLAKEVNDLKLLNASLQTHMNELKEKNEELRITALQAQYELENIISGTTSNG